MESRDEATIEEADTEVKPCDMDMNTDMYMDMIDMDMDLEPACETEETSDATLVLDGFDVLEGDCSITSFIDTKESHQIEKEDSDTTGAALTPIISRQID